MSELAPFMAETEVIKDDDPKEFYPGKTRRITALIERSPSVTDQLMMHPIGKQVCDAFLHDTCQSRERQTLNILEAWVKKTKTKPTVGRLMKALESSMASSDPCTLGGTPLLLQHQAR